MNRVVFLVEEQSMASFLDVWLHRTYPELEAKIVPHEGKRDLRRSIPRKLRAWREPGVQFVVVIDNDAADRLKLKADLVDLCNEAGRPDTLVRIAHQELEAWYLGDLDAIVAAFPATKIRAGPRSAKYRDPDAIPKPSEALTQLVPGFQKVAGARAIAAHLDRRRNRSASFAVFAAGIDRLAGH